MNARTPPPTPSRPVALKQFREGRGLVRLRGAADWLLAGGTPAAEPDLAGRIEATLTAALLDLPYALRTLSERGAHAWATLDTRAQTELAVDGWELLLSRDLAEDLREAGHPVLGVDVQRALATFDAALSHVEPWLSELADAREAIAELRAEHGLRERPWWHPAPPLARHPRRGTEAGLVTLMARASVSGSPTSLA